MFKRFLFVLVAFFSVSSFACTPAQPTSDVNFCETFKTAAGCYCSQSLPGCSRLSMQKIYSLMTTRYGSLEGACKNQSNTSVQDCIDGWNCYLHGGKKANGEACSSTELPCSN